jgi:two-component sensor histidine kinase
LVFLFLLVTYALSASEHNILVLHSYHNSFPWTAGFDRGLRELRAQQPEVMYYTEYMDATIEGVSLSDAEWIVYLQNKYGKLGLSGIIADSNPAAQLIAQHPDLFGGVPQVLYSNDSRELAPNQYSLDVDVETALAETGRLAIAQNPGLRYALVMDGGFSMADESLAALLDVLDDASIEVETIDTGSLAQMKTRLTDAESDTVAFYLPVLVPDGDIRLTPRETLEELTSVSAVPVYTFWSTLMGTGAVGGYVVDAGAAAGASVAALTDYSANGAFVENHQITRLYLDFTALREHRIRARRIPAGATVINRPEPFFVRHYTESLTVFALLVLSGLIVMIVLLRRNIVANRMLLVRETELERSASEKEMLYGEMNHRVKNNLNILKGLISLQIREAENETSRAHLEDVAGRVNTLLVLHQQLHEHEERTTVDTREYLESMIGNLTISTVSGNETVEFASSIESIPLDAKRAVSCGLIVNELITNTLKYAFPGDTHGSVSVALHTMDTSLAELVVADTGRGLPDGFNMDEDAGLGLKIVGALAEQLDGSFEMHGDNGTRVVIRFPLS